MLYLEHQKKPNNYDNTQASGDYTPIELGGHFMIIKQVAERQSSTGKPMIVVCFDFAADDRQKGYFMTAFNNDIRPEKKWPNAGTQYIVSEDADGKCTRSFKSFITALERSNHGFVIQWGDNFGSQFKNKKIGGVFGIVEEEYNGKTSKRHKLRWFCEYEKAANASVPAEKLLKNNAVTVPAPATSNSDFMQIPEEANEEIPF